MEIIRECLNTGHHKVIYWLFWHTCQTACAVTMTCPSCAVVVQHHRCSLRLWALPCGHRFDDRNFISLTHINLLHMKYWVNMVKRTDSIGLFYIRFYSCTLHRGYIVLCACLRGDVRSHDITTVEPA